MKPANKGDIYWPNCSFFAIYDGHGGSNCAEFLRDNLHYFVNFFFINFFNIFIIYLIKSLNKIFY